MVSSPCYTTSLLGRQSQQDAPKSRTLRLRSALRRTSLCDVEPPPTSALPKASTSFALATDNSQDCPLNASRRCGSNSVFEKSKSVYLQHSELADIYAHYPHAAHALCARNTVTTSNRRLAKTMQLFAKLLLNEHNTVSTVSAEEILKRKIKN